MKQVTVNIECHRDRRVPQHHLNLLRRPSLLDEKRRSCVASVLLLLLDK